jgi:alginate O-acetyltransferase complex protein AlgI
VQFTSLAYVAFLAASVAIFYALPGARARTWWLLLASLAFYVSLSGVWTLLLAAEVLVGYLAARLIARLGGAGGGRARLVLAGSIGLLVGMLAAVRYSGIVGPGGLFALGGVGVGSLGPVLGLLAPIGVSFWTLQSIAYLVDVYRGDAQPERHIVRYATYATFFPYVMAGPIPRPGRVLPQLGDAHRFDASRADSALPLILWGAFKKLVVADPLGVAVAAVFSSPRTFPGPRGGLVYVVAAVAFTIQIYCDFSGYTDIARGSARLFGVELAPNFDRPLLARSVREFWNRWHMTLTNWLRDYVYIPLGGNRVPTWRRYLNVLVTYLASGLWHGATAPLMVWAGFNAVVHVAGDATATARDRVASAVGLRAGGPARSFVQTAITLALTVIGLTVFRASTLADSAYILSGMLVPALKLSTLSHLGLTRAEILVAGLGVLTVLLVEYAFGRARVFEALRRGNAVVRWAAYGAAAVSVFVLSLWGPTYAAPAFIYLGIR